MSVEIEEYLRKVENHEVIKVRDFENSKTVSVNFTSRAFFNKIWDEMTVSSRGLFINTDYHEVVARGYNKFFNIGEREDSTLEYMRENMVFPVYSYLKENGYLGIVSYDKYEDTLEFYSKSMKGEHGDFSLMVKELFEKTYSKETINFIKEYSKENNVSFVYEVIYSEKDKHIIKYEKNELILLDVIYNSLNFKKIDYSELENTFKTRGIKIKEYVEKFNNWDEFEEWYNNVMNDENLKVEGYVIEDSNHYMVKLKLDYYINWKKMRTLALRVKKGKFIHKGKIPEKFFGFYTWLLTQDKESYDANDIISLRESYEKSLTT